MSIGSIGSTSAYTSTYASSTRTQKSDAKEMQEKLFASIDSDGNGSIDANELATALDAESTDDSAVTASVGIGPREDGQGFGLDVGLTIALPGIDPVLGRELVDAAHIVCPYSHATRGGLDVRLTLAD